MTEILWLVPSKPDNVSVGRKRIAGHLEKAGHSVALRKATPGNIRRVLTEEASYDVVIGTTRSGAIGGALLSLLGTTLLIDHVDPISQFERTHSRWLASLVRIGENISFLLSDATLFVYEQERNRIDRWSSASSKTDLGVEYDLFSNPSDESVSAARQALSDSVLKDRVAIYIGGLEPIYNIEALLRAAELLDEWSILIVGAGTLQRRVEDAARTHDSVEFLGSVPHETVPGLLQIADVGLSLVDDSRTLKILEYGAAGLPVVQLEGNARDRFGESLNYCSNDPKEIVTAIRGAQLGGTNMLREVSEQLDWKNIADTYIEVIESAAEDAVLN